MYVPEFGGRGGCCPLNLSQTKSMEGKASDFLVAAFLAMQPVSIVVSFAREIGGGFVSELAQEFFLEECFKNEVCVRYPSSQAYTKSVLKHIILAAEKDGQEVLEELYDLHSKFLKSCEGLPLAERCYKTYTFMTPESYQSNLARTLGVKVAAELIGRRLVTLRISLNMLDGDTGYFLWPAGLYFAEVLLSYPQLVHGKSCLELGSGTGICGILLSWLAPSKLVMTDGALSTLANLRHNLTINGVYSTAEDEQSIGHNYRNLDLEVDCRQLLWETVSENELQASRAQIIFGTDLIYDPTLVPHLVRVLALLLQKSPSRQGWTDLEEDPLESEQKNEEPAPVAYLASTRRNLNTLNLFLSSVAELALEVTDVTESMKPKEFFA